MSESILIPLAGGNFVVDETIFPPGSKIHRFEVLAGTGFNTTPETGIQRLAAGSLGWGTASEGALRLFFQPFGDAAQEHVGLTDAIIAACRVGRGLSEDRRTQKDPWATELISAGEQLGSEMPAFLSAFEAAADYRIRCLTESITLADYLGGLQAHPYALVGAAVTASGMYPEPTAAAIRDFTLSMGVLHGITERTMFSPNPRKPSKLVTPTVFLTETDTPPTGGDVEALRNVVTEHARTVLRATDVISASFADFGSFEEVRSRAFMTLRDASGLLRKLVNVGS